MSDISNLVKDMRRQADALGCCDMFRGDEDLLEIIDLLFSRGGSKFCFAHSFPDLPTFRRFLPWLPGQYGVFIDAGEIKTYDPERLFLIGNTQATIHLCGTRPYHIFLMHGAQADIMAEGHSVVFIKRDQSSRCHITKGNDAIILDHPC